MNNVNAACKIYVNGHLAQVMGSQTLPSDTVQFTFTYVIGSSGVFIESKVTPEVSFEEIISDLQEIEANLR